MRLVSIDVGNGWTKAKSRGRAAVFESIGAVEQGALKFTGLGKNETLVIDYDGERWALGQAAYSHGRHQVMAMGQSRVGRRNYKVLFAGGIAQVVRQSTPLAVVLSLPVQWYTGGRDAARRDMAGVYTVGLGGRTCTYEIRPENLHIVPEGFGSIAYEICNQDGTVRDGALGRMTVGVIDVGTRTTDFLYFDSLELAPVRSDGLDQTGMGTVWAMLKEEIARDYGRNLSEPEIDHALQVGYFDDADQQVDIRHLSARALETLGAAIMGKVTTLWQDGRDVQAILVTGGGAYHVFQYLDYPHKYLIEPGYLANCEGAFRFGLQRGFAHE